MNMMNNFEIIYSYYYMLKVIDHHDRTISSFVIQSDDPVVSVVLYPFAAFFHPKLIFLAYASVYYCSNYHLPTTFVYVIGTLLCLITTTILKKIMKR